MSNEPLFLRDIGASCDGRHVAASLNDGEITIWSTDSPEPVARCKPGFSGSESRYQIDASRGLIYSGTWEDGLTCFDYRNQRMIWHRKDIIGIQTVNISTALPNSVFLTLEAPDYRMSDPNAKSGIAELDAQTGRTKRMSDMGDWLFQHPTKAFMVVTDRGRRQAVRIYDGNQQELASAKMVHFAVMDVAFTDQWFALAEGEKGVRVIDYKGKTISSYMPQTRQPNCLTLAFSEGRLHVHDSWDGAFVFTIDPMSGKLLSEYKLPGGGDICFINSGLNFVNRRGEICRSSDGAVQFALKP